MPSRPSKDQMHWFHYTLFTLRGLTFSWFLMHLHFFCVGFTLFHRIWSIDIDVLYSFVWYPIWCFSLLQWQNNWSLAFGASYIWNNMNTLRTSHICWSRQCLQIIDQKGIVPELTSNDVLEIKKKVLVGYICHWAD